MEVAWTCLFIILARIADVSLGTIRTIITVQGRRHLAVACGFVEVSIWVFVVSNVIQSIQARPIFGVAYACGFSLGTFVGMTIERYLALGRQLIRVFTRQGPEMAASLRDNGYRVTQFDGYGRDGPVQELFIELERKQVPTVIRLARELDGRCFYTVDDVRLTSAAGLDQRQTTGWRSVLKKK
jgi:uncharacterized protein YebE (UPF0316 family)